MKKFAAVLIIAMVLSVSISVLFNIFSVELSELLEDFFDNLAIFCGVGEPTVE